jgi:hypothetical protein
MFFPKGAKELWIIWNNYFPKKNKKILFPCPSDLELKRWSNKTCRPFFNSWHFFRFRFYQIRSYIKSSSKHLMKFEVSFPSNQSMWDSLLWNSFLMPFNHFKKVDFFPFKLQSIFLKSSKLSTLSWDVSKWLSSD